MGSTPTCPHCGAELEPRIVKLGEREWHMGNRACTCPAAVREELERTAAEEAARLAREVEWRNARLESIGVPRRFWDSRLNERRHRLLEAVLEGSSLYMYGGVGSGKTETAAAIAAELSIAHRAIVRFVPEVQLMRRIKATYDGNGDERRLLDFYGSIGVLVIDDLGKEPPREWYVSKLYDLIDSRWSKRLSTIVTSNLDPDGLLNRLRRSGDPESADAVMSRLLSCRETIICYFGETDHRMDPANSVAGGVGGKAGRSADDGEVATGAALTQGNADARNK